MTTSFQAHPIKGWLTIVGEDTAIYADDSGRPSIKLAEWRDGAFKLTEAGLRAIVAIGGPSASTQAGSEG
jgi:hypothetical protein